MRIRSSRLPITALFVALASSGGCGRDALLDVPVTVPAVSQTDAAPGLTGTGGRVGGGGSAGTGGTGGTVARPDAGLLPPSIADAAVPRDAPPACMALPTCLAALAAACRTEGACMQQRGATGVSQCYADNVKLTVTPSAQGATARATHNGALCYTVVGNLTGRIGAPLTYSDASGRVVATGTFQGGPGGGLVVVSCIPSPGEPPTAPAVVDVACAPGGNALLGLAGAGAMTCANGSCMP